MKETKELEVSRKDILLLLDCLGAVLECMADMVQEVQEKIRDDEE